MKGTSWDGALRRKKAAGTPRRLREEARAPEIPRVVVPEEIGIDMEQDEFRAVLRQVIFEELGVGEVAIAERWRGGEVVIKPGRDGTQEKTIPLDVFFKKIVMIRDKLRVLEQKLNAHKGLDEAEKIQMQQYITGCYGSLTTFNALFHDRDDWFVGQSKK